MAVWGLGCGGGGGGVGVWWFEFRASECAGLPRFPWAVRSA